MGERSFPTKCMRSLRGLARALCLALAAGLLSAAPMRAQVVIVANSSVKTLEVSRQDLRDIFTGASSSLRGGHVTPVLLEGGAAHDQMLTLYIGKSEAAFQAGWRSVLFSGEGAMPKTVASETAVLEYVAHTPGALGYVGKAALRDGSKLDGVKILAVR